MFGPRRRLSQASLGPCVQTVDDYGAPTEADEAMDRLVAEIKPAEADPAPREKRRPWGYDVPDGDTWQKKIDARLGITNALGDGRQKGETDE
jgi:hypothetical protein